MKIKLKLVAAAVAMVVSGQAAASIPRGEMFVTVWDMVGQKSFAKDLGVTTSVFAANPTLTWDLSTDANYTTPVATPINTTSFLGLDPTQTLWALGAADMSGFTSSLFTSTNPVADVTPGSAPSYQGLNGTIDSERQALFGVPAGGSAVQQVGDLGYAGDPVWGTTAGTVFNIANQMDQASHVYLTSYDITKGNAGSIVTNLGDYTLSSTGSLAPAAAPAPVPVPAAAWLLGSALIGMAGMARRRDDEVAAA